MMTFFGLIKLACQNFFRQFWLSFVTIIIIAFSLFALSLLFSLNLLANLAIKNLEEKVAVNIYLKPNLTQEQIDFLKNRLIVLPETKEILYLSPEEALKFFEEKHKKNPLILKSLTLLEANPLGATLIIKSKSINGYQNILTVVNEPSYENIIADRDFREPQKIVSYVEKISQKTFAASLTVVGIFIFITIITIFNSIRLTIYSRQNEIKIMSLVGATPAFIKTPFIMESIFYVSIAWLANLGIFFYLFKITAVPLANFLEVEGNIFLNYQLSFIYFQLLLLFFMIIFSILISSLAVKKYIKA